MKSWFPVLFSLVCASGMAAEMPTKQVNPSKLALDFGHMSNQFLQSLWHKERDFSLSVGRYEFAGKLTVPDAANREQQREFINQWLGRVEAYQAQPLSRKEATDFVLLKNYLQGQRWYLDGLRQYEWDPSQYNIAGPIDQILNTNYAPKEQRLRTLSLRLQNVPAYWPEPASPYWSVYGWWHCPDAAARKHFQGRGNADLSSAHYCKHPNPPPQCGRI